LPLDDEGGKLVKTPYMRTMLAILCAICLAPVSAAAHTGVGAPAGFIAGFSHPFGGAFIAVT
jgi:hydrogenase/urease accessory protein HupE